jgi:hypothetical protein
MDRVTYNLENLNRCKCYECAVHDTSQCIINKMQSKGIRLPLSTEPSANDFEGLYCSETVSKSACGGINASKSCICPSCSVWMDANLSMQYYCANGSQVEREQGGKRDTGLRKS